MGPYLVLRRFGKVEYALEFSSSLRFIYPVFHVSILRKYMGDPSQIVSIRYIGILDSLSYEEVPVKILD